MERQQLGRRPTSPLSSPTRRLRALIWVIRRAVGRAWKPPLVISALAAAMGGKRPVRSRAAVAVNGRSFKGR